MARATIEITGKDSSGAAFQSAISNSKRLNQSAQEAAGGLGALQEASKKFGQETRDGADVGAKSMEGLAAVLDGRLSTAARGAGDIVKGFMSAGLWGAAAGAAKAAIELISAALDAAKEKALAFTEHLAKGFQAAAADFTSAKTEIGDMRKDMEDALKVTNATIANNAKMKVHDLHIQTLQKITDDMGAGAKKALEAEEKLAAAQIQAAANAEMRENERKAAEERLKRAREMVVAAEEQAAEVENTRVELTASQFEVIHGRVKLEQEIAAAEKKLADGVGDREVNERQLAELTKELKDYEAKHADVLKVFTEAEKAGEKAAQDLAAARREVASAETEAKLLQKRHSDALANDERTVMDMTAARREAVAAAKAEAEKAKAAAEAAKEKAEHERIVAKIEEGREAVLKKCKEAEVDSARVMKVYNDAVADGHDSMVALEMAQDELAKAFDERADAEKAAAEKAKKEAEEQKKKEGAEAFATVKAEIDKLTVKEAIDESETPRFQDLMRKARDAERKARDELAKSRRDLAPTVKWLKGDMPKEEAELFEKHLMASRNQATVKDLMSRAMRAELLSKAETREQNRKVRELLKRMTEMGVK